MEKIQKIPPAVLQQPDPGRGGDYQERTGCTDSKAKKLCRWLAGEKLLVYAPLLEWYLDHGLEITAVCQTVDYQPRKIFTWFVNEVTEEQAQRGKNPNKALLTEVFKLLRNNAHGKLMRTKSSKHGWFTPKTGSC